MANIKFLKRIGYSNINTLDDDNSAFFYQSGMEIDADGAYHAYHPDGKSGLDYLGNAGRPGNWWALVTDNAEASGRHPRRIIFALTVAWLKGTLRWRRIW